jgi:hypothetical protein
MVISRLSLRHNSTGNSRREQVAIDLRLSMRAANEEEGYMPVLLLWAIPTVIVVGGVGYYFLRVVH